MPSGIGTMVAVIGAAIGGAGTLMQMKAQKDQAAASQKAESAREKQMNLEAARQRRKVAREAQRRRAEVQANGTNQGAQQSSGVIGGVQQITSDETMQRRDVNEGQTYGAQVFKQIVKRLRRVLPVLSVQVCNHSEKVWLVRLTPSNVLVHTY